jgi:hypothetical protein
MRRRRVSLWIAALLLGAAGAAAQPTLPKEGASPAAVAAAREWAVTAADSANREERVRALRQLAATPDARALPALERLSKRTFAEPDEREQTWEQLAQVTAELADETDVPPDLEAFLRTIEKRRAEVKYLDRTTFEYPRERAKYRYAEAARSALEVIELRRARRRLETELSPLPLAEQTKRLAEAAWVAEGAPGTPRARAARALLGAAGKPGLDATREALGRASPESGRWIVEYVGAAFDADPSAATAALVQLAASADTVVSDAALAEIERRRPAGAAARLVEVAEQGAEPGRTRAVAWTLGQLGDPVALPFLRGAFRSGDPETAAAAARALAHLGGEGVGLLVSEVESGSGATRTAAVVGLFEVADQPAAREALGALAGRTRDPELRALIQERLGR